MPGRDGGRRKRKAVAWRKQATHAVDDPCQLSAQLATIRLPHARERSAAESIYQFDQRIAKLGIRYYAELYGTRRWYYFQIMVPAECVEKVNAIVTQLE